MLFNAFYIILYYIYHEPSLFMNMFTDVCPNMITNMFADMFANMFANGCGRALRPFDATVCTTCS